MKTLRILMLAMLFPTFVMTGCSKDPVDPPKFTVTFDTQGGSAVSPQTVTEGDKASKPADPIRAGHTFVGWYREAAGTTLWDFATEAVSANITLFAKWTQLPTYTVTFDSQGGSAVSPQTVIEGAKVTAPADPTRENYRFTGWFKEPEGATPWNFSTDAVSASRTLYAGWEQTGFTVTFHTNGGSEVASAIVISGAHAAEPLPPTRPLFAFAGWYTDNETFANAFDFATAITGDLDLYAAWTAVGQPELEALCVEAESALNHFQNYTPESLDALAQAMGEWQYVRHEFEPAPALIEEAYTAISTALAGLVELPYRSVVEITVNHNVVGGNIYAYPGEVLNIAAYGRDAQHNSATNSAVVFEIVLPAWASEELYRDENSLGIQVAADAPVGASVPIKIVSAENPALFAELTVLVVDTNDLKAQFMTAVAALPAPAAIDYADYEQLDALANQLSALSSGSYNPEEDPELTATLEKFEACRQALWDLPDRLQYAFSDATTATFTYMDYDGTTYPEDATTVTYAANGDFPAGTYTPAWYFDDYDDKWYQDILTLNADKTLTVSYWTADNAQGTGAVKDGSDDTGTYTIDGSKTAGGILYMSYNTYEADTPDPAPQVRSARSPRRSSILGRR